MACWRETYRHLLSPTLLERLDVEQRTRQWQQRLTDRGGDRCMVGVIGPAVIGFSAVTASRDDPPVRDLELAALYVLAAHHGRGLGQALLEAAVHGQPCSLWVAEANPRARAFYARNGFLPDGARKADPSLEGLVEVRLAR